MPAALIPIVACGLQPKAATRPHSPHAQDSVPATYGPGVLAAWTDATKAWTRASRIREGGGMLQFCKGPVASGGVAPRCRPCERRDPHRGIHLWGGVID